MSSIWQDIRFAARVLWKGRGFTAVAVMAVALGVGANTTMFSCVNALLLRPFSFSTTERAVMVWEKGVEGGFSHGSVAPANYLDWREQTKVFEELAAFNPQHFSLAEGDQPERIPGARVTPNLFRVLDVKAIRGRTFTDEEGEDGNNHVALIKESLWQRRFNSDPGVVGKVVRLDGANYTVVGVMSKDFEYPINASEIWTPLAFTAEEARNRGNHSYQVVGLLKPNASIEQADSEVRAVAERNRKLFPETNGGRTGFVESLTDSYTRGPKPYLIILMGAVGFVLLIACANVANLLLVRASSRQRELAVRAALGASRWRLVRQLLTESLLLALLGGALGLLMSVWGLDFMSKGLPPTFTKFIPGWKNMRIDTTVLLFTFAASVLTGFVFGIIPALQATRTNLNESLKEGGQKGAAGGLRRNRMRSLLVVAEVALSLVLLVGAGLMVRSFAEMMRADLGFKPRGVLSLVMSLPEAAYREPQQRITFYEQLTERTRAIPGVRDAAAINFIPVSREGTSSSTFTVEGQPAPEKGHEPFADYLVITPNYFEAAGTPILRGRAFTTADDERAPKVCIVTNSLARRYFPDGDAVGHRLLVSKREGPWEIVGVVADIKNEDLEEQPEWGFYRPLRQEPWHTMGLIVRGDEGADAATLAPAVRNEVRALDKDLPVYSVRTLEDIVGEAASAKRLAMLMMAFFGVGALVLAAVGLYSVMSYTVAQRTHEIGIRMALGAQGRDILRLVLSQGLLLTLTGLGIGGAIAFWMTSYMASILYHGSANDPLVFIGVAVVLAVAALLACFIPARRATKVDPMIALRYE